MKVLSFYVLERTKYTSAIYFWVYERRMYVDANNVICIIKCVNTFFHLWPSRSDTSENLCEMYHKMCQYFVVSFICDHLVRDTSSFTVLPGSGWFKNTFPKLYLKKTNKQTKTKTKQKQKTYQRKQLFHAQKYTMWLMLISKIWQLLDQKRSHE